MGIEKNKGNVLSAILVAVVMVSMGLRYMVIHGHSALLETGWLALCCAGFILYSAYKNRKQFAVFLKFDLLSMAFAVILSAVTFASFIINSNTFSTLPLKFAAFVAVLLVWYCFFRCMNLTCDEHMRTNGVGHLKLLHIVLLGLAFAAVLSVQYSCYWPWIWSPDTENQWMQIHGNINYNSIHAIGHTIYLKILLSIYDSYTLVVIFQLLCVVLIYLAFADFFYSKGVKLRTIAFVMLLSLSWISACSEAYFTPWKDTPAAICTAITVLLMMKYPDVRQIKLPAAALLGLVLAWCALFRLNGVIVLGVLGLYYLVQFLRNKSYRLLAAMLLPIIVSFSAVNIYSTAVLHTEKLDNGFSIQVFGSGIAAAVYDGNLSDEEREAIERLLPIEWMEQKYQNPVSKRALIWEYDGSSAVSEDENMRVFNNEFVLKMGENKMEIIALYFRLLPRHAGVMIKDIFGSIRMTWAMSSLFFVSSYIFQVCLLAFLIFKHRLKAKDCMVFLPTLCNTVSIMISTITNEVRYLLPSFMIMPFYILYILWKSSSIKEPLTGR